MIKLMALVALLVMYIVMIGFSRWRVHAVLITAVLLW